jgi:hypothetical protein
LYTSRDLVHSQVVRMSVLNNHLDVLVRCLHGPHLCHHLVYRLAAQRIQPVELDPRVVIGPTVSCMTKAVTSTRTSPPLLEPVGHLVADCAQLFNKQFLCTDGQVTGSN